MGSTTNLVVGATRMPRGDSLAGFFGDPQHADHDQYESDCAEDIDLHDTIKRTNDID